jgi:glycine/D-amino acid oxidase-like deaminating enzyme
MGVVAETVGSVFWLKPALGSDVGSLCPPLSGAVKADVCVVGGGYLGMWAALEMVEQAPDANVVLIEAEGCGFGASGRNGGWVTSWHDELQDLIARFGVERARWLAERSTWAIDRIAQMCDSEEIDCHLRRAGGLWCATAPAQMGAWEGAIAAGARAGRPGFVERLSVRQLRACTGSPVIVGGARLTDAAAVQPALLARGLRRVLLRRGVKIYEGTPMLQLERGTPAVLRTPAGQVQANAVVLGLGAWAAGVRELRSHFVDPRRWRWSPRGFGGGSRSWPMSG